MSDAIDGLLAVVLGGVIAALTNFIFAAVAERDKRLALAFSMSFKVLRISDVVYKTRKAVNESWQNVEGVEQWRTVIPILGVPNAHIEFTAEELSLFVVQGRVGEANKLIECAASYNLIVDLVHRYNTSRRELSGEISQRAHPEYSGIAGQIAFDPGTLILLQPRINETESLVTLLHSQVNDTFPRTTAASTDIPNCLKVLLRDKRFKLALGPADGIDLSHPSSTSYAK